MNTSRIVRRRGSLLVAVLACLLMVGLTSAALLRWMTLHQRQLNNAQWRQQSLWLAESGLSRARQQLAMDAEYEGETWRVEGQQLSRGNAAVVTIVCEAETETGEPKLVIEAVYPADSIHRVMHRISVPLKKQNSGDAS